MNSSIKHSSTGLNAKFTSSSIHYNTMCKTNKYNHKNPSNISHDIHNEAQISMRQKAQDAIYVLKITYKHILHNLKQHIGVQNTMIAFTDLYRIIHGLLCSSLACSICQIIVGTLYSKVISSFQPPNWHDVKFIIKFYREITNTNHSLAKNIIITTKLTLKHTLTLKTNTILTG